MDTFIYTYKDMMAWYKQNLNNPTFFDKDPSVICFVVEQKSEKELKKYTKTIRIGRFLIKSEDVKGTVRKIRFCKKKKYFPMGLYSVIVGNNLYCVFPNMRGNLKGETHIFGDHMSFMYNKGCEKHVQFHLTSYTPEALDINIGITNYYHNHFADNIKLPLYSYDTDLIHEKTIKSFCGDDVLDLARAYKTLSGGGSQKYSTTYLPRSASIVTPQLDRMLTHEKVTKVVAFGMKKDDVWFVSTYVERDIKFKKQVQDEVAEDDNAFAEAGETNRNYCLSYTFTMRNKGLHTFQKELSKVLKANMSID